MVASGGPVNCAFSLLTAAGTEARRYVVPPAGPTTAFPAILLGVTVVAPGVPVCGAGPTLNN